MSATTSTRRKTTAARSAGEAKGARGAGEGPGRGGRPRGAGRGARAEGLVFERWWTKPGVDPFDAVEWELRTAAITGERGEVIFEQRDVEVPRVWSQLATNVVASKYFRGPMGDPSRERSARQLIGRVVRTIVGWGRDGGYFATEGDADTFRDELTHLLLHQMASFNSPVWFNLGVPGARPQASACFINSVEDTMESIMQLAATEALLFKGGSGTGTNLSPIRSSKEPLAGGGIASGPVSFMRGYDAFAGVVKSGGKTRRAAKMVILDVDHPDIVEFIKSKAEEEKKAWALIEAGYNGGFNVPGGAYDSIFFQNANHSVRVTDEFMRAVEANGDWHTRFVLTGEVAETFKARDLIHQIADATHICGDPGMQFDTTINRWHTCKNTDRIYASNPCAEFMFLNDTACNLASLNLMKFRTADGEFDPEAFAHACEVVITAQEIIVDSASYPTQKIAQNSYDYRPLGLGYANLGALLMSWGLPYDSDAGRAAAGAITALMTGAAYRQSARIASFLGPFAGYDRNREPMLEVMALHRAAVDGIDARLVEPGLLEAARGAWDDALSLGRAHGYRNSQASVLAPTGCLVGGSLVATDRGLVRLNRLGDPQGEPWQNVSFRVVTDDGPQQATKFFINGVAPTRVIRTKSGYTIQGTVKHQIKVVDGSTGKWLWRRFDALQPGDVVPLTMNSLIGEPREVALPPLGDIYWTGDWNTRVPRRMSPDLAELIGYFMGDGSLHAKGLRFCVTEADEDVVSHLTDRVRGLFNLPVHVTRKAGYWEVAVHSVPLAIWWEACGFARQKPREEHAGKGYRPYIPDAVLHTNDAAVYHAFLRGLFEADGTILTGVPSLATACAEFAQEVRTLLLALGYPTSTRQDESGWGQEIVYGLRLRNGSFNAAFRARIGFLGRRKQVAITDLVGTQSGKRDYIYLAPELVDEVVPASSSHRNAVLLSLRRHGGVPRQRVATLYAESQDERLAEALGYFYDVVESNEDGGEQPTYDLSVPANVTYVANGFISHNTIAFMMDCDTTGIEPDIALVKYKTLVGGGVMKIVNQTVPEALRRLGYRAKEITAIVDAIDANSTIEGAPFLREEDLPVFDCAFRAASGTRSIHYMGHLRMMAAVQPFISGAISKTCNVPEDITVEEIEQVYIDAWKLGLKAVAIYRDGSKRTQPLATSLGEGAPKAAGEARPLRRKLPDERRSITHKFSIAGHEGYVTVGMYEDGSPGEIFIVMSKEGSVVSGLMDSFATAISLALQYGVPLRVLVNKFSHTRFEPAGWTNNKEIPIAKSVMDYIFRWLALKFLPQDEAAAAEPAPSLTNGHTNGTSPGSGGAALPIAAYLSQEDAPPCSDCGAIMIRNGSCYRCLNCGSTSGCS